MLDKLRDLILQRARATVRSQRILRKQHPSIFHLTVFLARLSLPLRRNARVTGHQRVRLRPAVLRQLPPRVRGI